MMGKLKLHGTNRKIKNCFVFLLEVFNENVPYKPKFLQSIKHLYLVISKWGLEHYGLP